MCIYFSMKNTECVNQKITNFQWPCAFSYKHLIMSYRQLITILILLNCCSLVSNAQKKNHLPVTQHNTVVSQLLRMNRQTTAQKTTAGIPTQRVIAQSTWDHTLSDYADSVELRYSGMRKSEYDYNNMIYAYNYPYGTTPMFNYAGIHTTPQVQYDTFVHWTINPFTMPTFMLYEGWFANYDTLNNLIGFRQLYIDSVTNDNKAYRNIFTNDDHNIKEGYWFNLNAGVEDSAFIQYFQYDTTGLLTADSVYELHLGVWRIAAKTYYGHDTSGNLTLIDHYANVSDTSFLLPLVQQSKYVNTYDTSNRLASVYTSLHNGTSLLPYVKDTFDYMGTLTFHTAWRQHQMDGIHGT